jgi:hypothetical protein
VSHTKSIDIGTFSAGWAVQGGNIEVSIAGEADAAALGHLEEILAALHASACDRHVKEVVVDLRKLVFMSSSCLTKVIAWVNRVRVLDETDRYAIRLLSDQTLLWQKRSLHALQCFAAGVISLQT